MQDHSPSLVIEAPNEDFFSNYENCAIFIPKWTVLCSWINCPSKTNSKTDIEWILQAKARWEMIRIVIKLENCLSNFFLQVVICFHPATRSQGQYLVFFSKFTVSILKPNWPKFRFHWNTSLGSLHFCRHPCYFLFNSTEPERYSQETILPYYYYWQLLLYLSCLFTVKFLLFVQ